MARRDLQLGAILFAAAAAIYGYGACRTIYVGDSGELVAAVHTLGIPHPSGYPLYVLLGKLWTIVAPFGSIATRMSVFSVVTAAATVALLFLLGRRLALGRPAAALAAAAFALIPSFWSQANIQRVYSLNALFVVACLLATVHWLQSGRRRYLWGALLLAGLGASNHLFMGIQGTLTVLFAWWARPAARRDSRLWGGAGFALAAGLSPYLFLLFRSRADPRLDWGDPETLGGLIRHVTRSSHWSRAWIEGPGDLLTIVGDYSRSLAGEYLIVGALLALIGLLLARRAAWPHGLLLLVMAGNLGAMAWHGSRADLFIWHRYYIPSYLVFSLYLGAGVDWLHGQRLRRWAPVTWLLPVALLVSGWRAHDRSDYEIGEAFSRRLLADLPPGAHLAPSDDNILFVLIYLHLVDGARPDVDLILQGVGDAGLPTLQFDPGNEDLFFTHHPNWSLPAIDVLPRGLSFQVVRRGELPRPIAPLPPALPGENDPRVPKDYLTQNLIGHFHYMRGLGFERDDWLSAVAEFRLAAERAPANDVLFYNLGLILQRNGRLEMARAAFARADWINPRGIVSNRPARASERIDALNEELKQRDSTTVARSLDPEEEALWRALGEEPGS